MIRIAGHCRRDERVVAAVGIHDQQRAARLDLVFEFAMHFIGDARPDHRRQPRTEHGTAGQETQELRAAEHDAERRYRHRDEPGEQARHAAKSGAAAERRHEIVLDVEIAVRNFLELNVGARGQRNAFLGYAALAQRLHRAMRRFRCVERVDVTLHDADSREMPELSMKSPCHARRLRRRRKVRVPMRNAMTRTSMSANCKAYSEYAVVVMRASAGSRESSRVCCTTTGAEATKTLA